MSTLIVKIQKVTNVTTHPNADRLDLILVGDTWQVVTKRDEFKAGDLVVFVPPDAILSKSLMDFLGIANYCGELPKGSDDALEGRRRVKATRLRGEKSFGTVMSIDQLAYYFYNHNSPGSMLPMYLGEGVDVADLLGITKWEPVEKCLDGDSERPYSAFHLYTEIENVKNYPDILETNEEVVMTEKVHGQNLRMGYVLTDEGWQWMCGSKTVNRKPTTASGKPSVFWRHLTQNVKDMMLWIHQNYVATQSIIVFAENFGPVQDMEYGRKDYDFVVFDIAIDGQYLDWPKISNLCMRYDVPLVIPIYTGPYSDAKLEELTDGPTLMCPPDKAGKFKGREGIVVHPTIERADRRIGRVIFKSISIDYLGRKGGTDNA